MLPMDNLFFSIINNLSLTLNDNKIELICYIPFHILIIIWIQGLLIK